MKKQRLSPEQAFAAMFVFLDRYYGRTGSGDIGALLGDLQLDRRDGLPIDPAAWDDWLAAVAEALGNRDRAEPVASVQRKIG
jgi:hypothetical protein